MSIILNKKICLQKMLAVVGGRCVKKNHGLNKIYFLKGTLTSKSCLYDKESRKLERFGQFNHFYQMQALLLSVCLHVCLYVCLCGVWLSVSFFSIYLSILFIFISISIYLSIYISIYLIYQDVIIVIILSKLCIF